MNIEKTKNFLFTIKDELEVEIGEYTVYAKDLTAAKLELSKYSFLGKPSLTMVT